MLTTTCLQPKWSPGATRGTAPQVWSHDPWSQVDQCTHRVKHLAIKMSLQNPKWICTQTLWVSRWFVCVDFTKNKGHLQNKNKWIPNVSPGQGFTSCIANCFWQITEVWNRCATDERRNEVFIQPSKVDVRSIHQRPHRWPFQWLHAVPHSALQPWSLPNLMHHHHLRYHVETPAPLVLIP